MISVDRYTKSSHSGYGSCVEVRLLSDGRVALRDSKDVTKPPHEFTPAEWRAFLDGVRDGEFDI